jgi:hypothetical protein
MSRPYHVAVNEHNGLTNREAVALAVLVALIARANASYAHYPLVQEAFDYAEDFFSEAKNRQI